MIWVARSPDFCPLRTCFHSGDNGFYKNEYFYLLGTDEVSILYFWNSKVGKDAQLFLFHSQFHFWSKQKHQIQADQGHILQPWNKNLQTLQFLL